MTAQTATDTGRRDRRKARGECRLDRHRYGALQPIGGGIARRVCLSCGAVSIDLTAAENPGAEHLFRARASLPEPHTR